MILLATTRRKRIKLKRQKKNMGKENSTDESEDEIPEILWDTIWDTFWSLLSSNQKKNIEDINFSSSDDEKVWQIK